MSETAESSTRVLVTGGGLGIGCSTTSYLLKQFNARVVVLTLDVGAEMQALQNDPSTSSRLHVYQGDVTKVQLPILIISIECSLTPG